MVTHQASNSWRLRIPGAAMAFIIPGLLLWSCQPAPAPSEASIDLVQGARGEAETTETASVDTKNQPRLPEPFATMIDDGNPAQALRMLAQRWDRGDDPRTTRAIRTRALEAIARAGAFAIGDQSYGLADIRIVYEWMINGPDIFHYRHVVRGDLAPERFLYLAVAAGEEHSAPPADGGAYVLPDIDLPAALASPDPWVVSAALFLARKQDIEIDLKDLLARWQGLQAWDEACTEQALLYLASRPLGEFDQGAEGLPSEVAGLESAHPDGVEIQAWLYLSSAEWAPDLVLLEPGQGLTLEVRDSTMDVIGERLAESEAETMKLSATRNYYSFRYLDGPMHGKSRFIDGTAGTFVRMAVPVVGGV